LDSGFVCLILLRSFHDSLSLLSGEAVILVIEIQLMVEKSGSLHLRVVKVQAQVAIKAGQGCMVFLKSL
jgi:hypothetical protein